jgi:hypothetical protein
VSTATAQGTRPALCAIITAASSVMFVILKFFIASMKTSLCRHQSSQKTCFVLAVPWLDLRGRRHPLQRRRSASAAHCSDRDRHSQRGRGMSAGPVLNSHRQAILEKICSAPRSVMVGNCLHPCWSALRWQNDTEYNARVWTQLSRAQT